MSIKTITNIIAVILLLLVFSGAFEGAYMMLLLVGTGMILMVLLPVLAHIKDRADTRKFLKEHNKRMLDKNKNEAK